EFCFRELDYVGVLLSPAATVDVGAQRAHGALLDDFSKTRPDRRSATYMLVQVCIRASPVGVKEPVNAVPRNRDRLHLCADRFGSLTKTRVARSEGRELGQVVAHQPEAGKELVVPLENDHALCDALHFTQAGDRI